ncbi:MAG: hypothetical protein M0Z46_17025 [Actinomycetota bacterium]|nr:hypothetical protein [Actinomycetota bacterium]MDA8312272.1 hypothetical protein [Actinomycetota bacterium]MDA8314275.1 hypothetical protein [Actinomycetota bacterium]
MDGGGGRLDPLELLDAEKPVASSPNTTTAATTTSAPTRRRRTRSEARRRAGDGVRRGEAGLGAGHDAADPAVLARGPPRGGGVARMDLTAGTRLDAWP